VDDGFPQPQRIEASRPWGPPAIAAAALLAALIATPPADAATHHPRAHRSAEDVASRAAGDPIMAIVSLKSQRVTIYDADGWILRAPVSSGMHGRETPAGVFSVIQKDKDHHSNLYDDASMPNMLRVTWSGIALHGGPLPGHAASHGCVRMPYAFAEHLFPEAKIGMRVIIAPHDVTPVDITHPVLFSPKPDAEAQAKALAATAADAAKTADTARLAAVTATRDAARASAVAHRLEILKTRADGQFAAAERADNAATSDDAKARTAIVKQKAAAAVADLQTQLDAATADVKTKQDAVMPARDAAAAAETRHADAAKAAREAAPARISVFISRKKQRLYVRHGFEPVFDVPVTIRDPDQPIGTHVFTAVAHTDAGFRWTAVTVDGAGGADGSAKSALDRITIPKDVLDRIASNAAVGSSLIVSDEGLSSETGKGTEFVAVLSDQPQGGLAMRHHPTTSGVRYARQRNYWDADNGYQSPRVNYYPQQRSFFGGWSSW
jgi:hypothetical protein